MSNDANCENLRHIINHYIEISLNDMIENEMMPAFPWNKFPHDKKFDNL
jgi:hypothetical protein